MYWIPVTGGNVLLLAGAIVLGGFFSEDGATLTAVTLVASNALDARIAFPSAFFGLWIGDLWVFLLARSSGHRS